MHILHERPFSLCVAAMLVWEQANLDQIGEETVSLKPVLTDPVFL